MGRVRDINNVKRSNPLKYFFVAMQITGTIQCPVLALGAGILLDEMYGTRPWIMFALFIAAIIFTIYSIYQAVLQHQNFNSGKE